MRGWHMSVYKRSYRPYSGPLTGERSRFFVLVRYALSDIWSSRITNVLFVLCLVPTLVAMVYLYIMNNDAVRLLISGSNPPPALQISPHVFYIMILAQFWPALALTAWAGPRLIAGDMSNNALPVILSHPVTRVEYVLAKFTVLAGILSVVTWIPALLLFAFQSHVSAVPWAAANIQIATGMLLGGLLWVSFLSLMALALASWVKWRIVATGMVIAVMFVPAGMGSVFNAIMRTDFGTLLNVPSLMTSIWRQLIGYQAPSFSTAHDLPMGTALLAIGVMGLLFVAALNARIRAREVVRG